MRNPAAAAQIPPHKRWQNAAPGYRMPVGNLTSQFFANVYLNALDQFVKHTLKVRHYVRYVDDFVLLGESPAQLQAWQVKMEAFLHNTLRLRQEPLLRPCLQGVDFFGYIVFSHRRRVRLRQQIFGRMPWLHNFFTLAAEASLIVNTPERWQVLFRYIYGSCKRTLFGGYKLI